MSSPYGMGFRSNNVYSIRDYTGRIVGKFSVNKSDKKKGRQKNKKVQYNFKQLSSSILRSKTSGGARQALTKARGKIAMLRKQLLSGEYDSRAIANALAHAEKMAKVAKKRMKHFEEEEEADKTGKAKEMEGLPDSDNPKESEDNFLFDELSDEELDELVKGIRDEMAELMTEVMEKLEESNMPDELFDDFMLQTEDVSPEDLERIKKKHRSEELRDIVEADMKYLKYLFEQLEKERAEASSGISLELGGIDIPVAAPDIPVSSEGGIVDVTV